MGRTFCTRALASFIAGFRFHDCYLSVSEFAGQSANQSDLIFDSVTHSVSQSVYQSVAVQSI